MASSQTPLSLVTGAFALRLALPGRRIEAEQRGIPVSTLARDLLLSQLAGSDDSVKALVAKIRAELDDLATRVA